MKAEEAKKLAHTAIESLAAALHAGQSEALATYLTAMARFHDYSISNVMLIVMQRPDATHVAGFNAWKKLNRFVKKGEKGIVIIAPMLMRRKEADSDVQASDETDSILRFKAVYVFDIAQTDGEPLPEFAQVTGDPGTYTERLRAHVAARGITLDYTPDLGTALGRSSGGRIQLRTGLPPAEEFATLVHEVAHELLHRGPRKATLSKTVVETEAEAVAFVVCQAVGLHTGTASADYIRLYAGNQDTLAESLDLIQHTAADIIKAVLDDAP